MNSAAGETFLCCLRCKATPLKLLAASNDEIAFYQCPSCDRQFARQPGGPLVFRWLHPISLLLYPIIHTRHPKGEVERVTSMLLHEKTADEIDVIIRETELELIDPTQTVRDILTLQTDVSEETVREYLTVVVEHLKAGRRDKG